MTTAQDKDSSAVATDENQKTPTTRQKVTGDELEAKLSAWAEAQREKRASRTADDRRNIVRTRMTLFLGVVILVLVIASALMNESLTASESQNAQQISELQSELAGMQTEPDLADTSAALAELTDAAAADATAVAEAQQRFAELFRQAAVEPMPGNGAPSDAMLQTVEQRKVLAEYFDTGSYVVTDDEEAYRWMTLQPFDVATEIDPRFEWYIRYDGQQASDPSTYRWALETVMPDMDGGKDQMASTDRAQVIWTCRETDSGRVLAWATSTYDSKDGEGLFTDLELVVTTAGAEHTLQVTNGGEK